MNYLRHPSCLIMTNCSFIFLGRGIHHRAMMVKVKIWCFIFKALGSHHLLSMDVYLLLSDITFCLKHWEHPAFSSIRADASFKPYQLHSCWCNEISMFPTSGQGSLSQGPVCASLWTQTNLHGSNQAVSFIRPRLITFMFCCLGATTLLTQ